MNNYWAQSRTMSFVIGAETLEGAIAAGLATGKPFDVSGPWGAIEWDWQEREYLPRAAKTTVGPVDIAWIDDNDGRGPCKLSNSVRCF